MGIVPNDPSFVDRVVEVCTRIKKIYCVGKCAEAVGKAGGDVEKAIVIRGKG